MMTSKSFNKWTQQEIEDVFNLKLVKTHPLLTTWLNLTLPPELKPTEQELLFLQEIQLEAQPVIESWTEFELIFKFISFIVRFAHLSGDHYQSFGDRPLSAKVGEHTLHGRVDFMVASGKYEPKSPYFCFHEYKTTKPGRDSDPIGQLLATMLVAQALNKNEHPIYGAYIIGKWWQFVILVNNTYAISSSYDSATEDLTDILHILKSLNLLIPQMLVPKP